MAGRCFETTFRDEDRETRDEMALRWAIGAPMLRRQVAGARRRPNLLAIVEVGGLWQGHWKEQDALLKTYPIDNFFEAIPGSWSKRPGAAISDRNPSPRNVYSGRQEWQYGSGESKQRVSRRTKARERLDMDRVSSMR